MNISQIKEKLADLTNSLGPFAPIPERDLSQLRVRMKNEIDAVEEAISEQNDSEMLYELGVSYNLYCAWYLRGADRKSVLEKTIYFLQSSIDIAENPKVSTELARILIEDKPVRDLRRALAIVDKLRQQDQLPDWMTSIVAKAKRWAGQYDIPQNTSFKELSATPASLREERTKLRKILIDQLKQKEPKGMEIVARRLYNLGLLTAYLYGDFDASSGVSGYQFDVAEKHFRKAAGKFNFSYLGRIQGATFLTETDYKRIEKALGSSTETISLTEISRLL